MVSPPPIKSSCISGMLISSCRRKTSELADAHFEHCRFICIICLRKEFVISANSSLAASIVSRSLRNFEEWNICIFTFLTRNLPF